jgi:hypothetical protein
MRYSFAIFAAVAAAAPQVQPISQISDGQIQAPPATMPSVIPSAVPSVGASVPAAVSSVLASMAPSVAPSAVVPGASMSAPVGMFVPVA